MNENNITVFLNSTLTKDMNTIKNKVIMYFYNSIPDKDNKKLLSNNNFKANSKICAMLSFYKNNSMKCNDIVRKQIYENNLNSKWIFFEANPIARYRISKFKDKNEFSRICLKSQYHQDSIYINNYDNNRWNMILKETDIKVNDWRKDGKHILFILNSCKHCGYSMKDVDLHQWVNSTIKIIRDSGCKRKIVIRLKCGNDKLKVNKKKKYISYFHLDKEIKYHDPLNNIEFANKNKLGLLKELENAWCSVVYSTSACVISIIKGIPVFYQSENTITSKVSSNDFSNIENPYMPDRDKFFREFSNQIWSLEEIKSGIVWEKIKKNLV